MNTKVWNCLMKQDRCPACLQVIGAVNSGWIHGARFHFNPCYLFAHSKLRVEGRSKRGKKVDYYAFRKLFPQPELVTMMELAQ